MSIASIFLVWATSHPSFLFHYFLIYIELCLPIIVFRGYGKVAISSSSSYAVFLRYFLSLYYSTCNIERLIRPSTFFILFVD
jgi:hypothetical protein